MYDPQSYLMRDSLLHVCALDVLARRTAEVVAQNDEGLLLFDTLSRSHMISAENREAARELLDKLPSSELFMAYQDSYLDLIEQRFTLKRSMCCYQGVWTGSKLLQQMSESTDGRAIRPLCQADLQRAMELYSHPMDRAYMQGRIAAAELFGCFIEGVLAGMIGLHEEGAMGMLEVDSAYRRQHIATDLSLFLIDYLLKRGRQPFSQFLTENLASRRLQEQLGFTIVEQPIYWLERPANHS